jgi:hypothetical protein
VSEWVKDLLGGGRGGEVWMCAYVLPPTSYQLFDTRIPNPEKYT